MIITCLNSYLYFLHFFCALLQCYVKNPTNWALVIEEVQARDAGRYTCTLQTYPQQSLIVNLQVNGGPASIS